MGTEQKVHSVPVSLVGEINSSNHDALVVVTVPGTPPPQALEDFIAAAVQTDKGLEKKPGVLHCARVSGNRLVLSPTGPLTPYDDVRSVYEAALAGVRRAAEAGARRPVLAVPAAAAWPRAPLVALLGALEALYVPIQIRETFPSQAHSIKSLGVYGEGVTNINNVIRDACALEAARGVSRDIGGADPERMTPLRVAEYVRGAFGPAVRVRVEDDPHELAKNYPLFEAVNRAANQVPRHRGCVIFLDYEPESYEETVMLVGKGVTYDTGGCDIKAGGVMAGMSRDKCGAAAVAGFLKACELLKPSLRVSAALCMVRNSVGSEAYVADELIKCRRGLAVRVGNTDAEGRMVMADVLDEMRERAESARRPHVYTVATLTGHAVRAVGPAYTIVMDNHAARAKGHAEAFRASGESIADMVEVSTIRREDLAFHRGQCPGDHVHQANNQPSTQTNRGHQVLTPTLLIVHRRHGGGVHHPARGPGLPPRPVPRRPRAPGQQPALHADQPGPPGSGRLPAAGVGTGGRRGAVLARGRGGLGRLPPRAAHRRPPARPRRALQAAQLLSSPCPLVAKLPPGHSNRLLN
ncbi:putative aminopeptidase W07G4.4 isoform X2 [Cydia splendana]